MTTAWRRWAVLFVAAAILALAIGLRAPRLAERPMHGDEANQAVKAGLLRETGRYVYDPAEHHGPTLYYFTLPVAWLLGQHTLADMTEYTVRTVPLIFGFGVVLSVVLMADALGWGAVLVAMLLLAASPSMVFYSGYYVQEILLVFFTATTLGSAWRCINAAQTPTTTKSSLFWAIVTGLSLGLMHATKETCVFAFAAMITATLLAAWWTRWRTGRPLNAIAVAPPVGHIVALGIVAAVVSVVFFTSFGTNLRGPLDSILTYTSYLHRSEGGGLHAKPWYYYLTLLTYNRYGNGPVWSEAIIVVLALAGVLRALRDRATTRAATFMRFLAFYTIILFTLYSIIPYKTPWCILSVLYPLALLAGYGAAGVWRALTNRTLRVGCVIVFAVAIVHLLAQDVRATGRYATHPSNPYAYAHTSGSFMRLVERVNDIAAIAPDAKNLTINVIAPPMDYWPLPWYLRAYPRVGYWPEPPEDVDAEIIIVSPKYQAEVEQRLKGHYQSEYHGLRPDTVLAVYIEAGLWEAFMRKVEAGAVAAVPVKTNSE